VKPKTTLLANAAFGFKRQSPGTVTGADDEDDPSQREDRKTPHFDGKGSKENPLAAIGVN